MKLLISLFTDPYINLATEEYLLKHDGEDYIFLYFNQPCVVVGKHQVVQKEINPFFVRDHNILVCRRLSGGGAVYHDEGNLNFSFIQNFQPGEMAGYQAITKTIRDFLNQLGLEITSSKRNDMVLADRKISGSAMHIYKNRVIAHGTLLITCNLINLSSSLKGNTERYADKSIASVRAKVGNLSDTLGEFMVSEFITQYQEFLFSCYPEIQLHCLDAQVLEVITTLATQKYRTMDWIYNYSPAYTFQNRLQIDDLSCHLNLVVEKGIISTVSLEPINQIKPDILLKFSQMTGLPHNLSSLTDFFTSPGTEFDYTQLLEALF